MSVLQRRSTGFLWAVLTVMVMTACQPEKSAEEKTQLQVGVVTMATEVYENTMELPGRTSAFRTAEVRPQVGGIILKRQFQEGSLVELNQSLYQIDPSTYQATLKSAEAALALTESKERRYKNLLNNRAVSKLEYDEANAALLGAQAQYDMAKIEMDYTKVRAPISGRIGRSLVSEGALVSSNQTNALATIKQLDPIYVDVTQPVKELMHLRREHEKGKLQKVDDGSAKVRLILEDGTVYEHPGSLKFNEVTVDEGTSSVTLRAIFPNPDEHLMPGMFVHARLVGGVNRNAILAPQQGVTRNVRGEPIAFVVNDEDKVEERQLDAMQTVGNRWLIRSGLDAGDRLITEGLQRIKPGMKVAVRDAVNVAMNSNAQK